MNSTLQIDLIRIQSIQFMIISTMLRIIPQLIFQEYYVQKSCLISFPEHIKDRTKYFILTVTCCLCLSHRFSGLDWLQYTLYRSTNLNLSILPYQISQYLTGGNQYLCHYDTHIPISDKLIRKVGHEVSQLIQNHSNMYTYGLALSAE